ncbi:MAG: DUF2971 domain-containing protein [Oceanicaulis sp.]|jgi:hypothetical protein|nr:DUF2971 domain-containing protein [Oceanicaulis sp.]
MSFYEEKAAWAREMCGTSLEDWENGNTTADLVVMESALYALHRKIEFAYQTRRALSHYTDINAFLSMISKNSIRFYDVKYMNDFTEKQHALEIVKSQIQKYNQKIKFGKLGSKIPQVLLKAIENEEDAFTTLSFCLSQAQDNVSQWNAYSSENGIEILFSAKQLFNFQRESRYRNAVADIIYSDSEKKRLTDAVITQIVWVIIHILNKTNGDRKHVGYAVTGAIRSIKYLMLRFKDNSFLDERETRYILECTKNNPNLKYECRGGYVRSYLELSKENADGSPKKLPINSVRIAPGRNAEDRKHSIEDALRRHGYNRPSVKISSVPLRHFG